MLPARDVTKLAGFYREKLGFDLAFVDSSTADRDNPRYVGVRRDGIELHIQWHGPDEWKSMVRPLLKFVVDDIDALFAEYKPQGVFHDRTELRNTAWGTREFGFYDPEDNGLVFYRDLKPGESA